MDTGEPQRLEPTTSNQLAVEAVESPIAEAQDPNSLPETTREFEVSPDGRVELPDLISDSEGGVAWLMTYAPVSGVAANGGWVRFSQFVVGYSSLEAAAAHSDLVPGPDNIIRPDDSVTAPFYGSYRDEAQVGRQRCDQLLDTGYRGQSLETMLADGPTEQEHEIFQRYVAIWERAQAEQRLIERIHRLPAPDLLPPATDQTLTANDPELSQGQPNRWESVEDLNLQVRARLDRLQRLLTAEPPVATTEIIEAWAALESVADQVLTTIARGGEDEERRCREHHVGSELGHAGYKVELTGPHDRSHDNDIYCTYHARERLAELHRAQTEAVVVRLPGAHTSIGLPFPEDIKPSDYIIRR